MDRRRQLIGLAFVVAVVALSIAQQWIDRAVLAQGKSAVQAPRFEVDPMWPRPLPN